MTNENRLSRDDGWIEKEDAVLLEIVLRTIEEGGTLSSAFLQAGNALDRTFGAVRFRYYHMIKHNHNHVIKEARNKQVQRINAEVKA